MGNSSNVRALVTGPINFRCPVCGKIEPRYNSIVLCLATRIGKRDRTICIYCAQQIWEAINILNQDDKGDDDGS